MAGKILGLLLAFAAAVSAAPQNVEFSILLPSVERVYLLGTFNNWIESDESLMSNHDGLWTKTVRLEEGRQEYFFRAKGGTNSGKKTTSDWKSPRLRKEEDGSYHSILMVPEDLDAYRARFRQGSTSPDGIDVPLSYLAYPDKDPAYFASGYNGLNLSISRPAGEWVLPEFKSREPLYTVLELGDSRFLAVLDCSTRDASFYDRLYFDRNGNRDLTDEEPLVAIGDRNLSGHYSCSFPAVDVQMKAAGQTFPYRLGWYLYGSLPPSGSASDSQAEDMRLRSINLFIKPACSYMGEFLLDGTAYRVALGDNTANGTFNDKVSLLDTMHASNGRLYPNGDAFLISPNNYMSARNIQLLGDFLAIGDHLFQLHLDMPAGRLRLEPMEAGRVELPGPMQSLSLFSSSKQGLMAFDPGQQVPVPPGDWTLLNYSLLKKDAWGDTWMLQASGSENTPVLHVPLQDTVTLDVGDPLKSQVQISENELSLAVEKGSLRMSFLLRGKQDEVITALQRIAGDRSQHETSTRYSDRPKEPTYRIIKPDGEQVASGSFEYG